MTPPSTTDGEVRADDPADPFQRVIRRIERAAGLDTPARIFELGSNALNRSAAGPILRGVPIGHALHPLLSDLPLGCWLSAGLLDVLGGAGTRPARRRLVGLGLVAALPTAAAGLTEWKSLYDRSTRRTAVVHGVGNVAALLLYLLSWLRRRDGRHAAGTAWGMAGGLLAIFTGYLGGHLSFGRGVGDGERWSVESGGAPPLHGDEANEWHRGKTGPTDSV
jgi:uncharacterized membrane protein